MILGGNRKKRGYVLAVTIVLCSLVFFLLAFSGLGNINVQLLDDVLYAQHALDAYYALENDAVARMMYDPTWDAGFDRTYLQDPLASASLTFTATGGAPWSVNNFGSTDTATGWGGRKIPPGYSHLVIPSQAPDYTPQNPLDNSQSIRLLHQAMVNIYYQYWFEDFNGDGRGSASRNTWDRGGGTISGSYCFLGRFSSKGCSFAEAGEDWWEDYDLEAIVAYYGIGGFGFIVRSDNLDGYAVLIVPTLSGDTLTGATIQFCSTGGGGQNWAPLTEDFLSFQNVVTDDSPPDNPNPFVKAQPEYQDGDAANNDYSKTPNFTAPYGLWKIIFSVENRDINDFDSMFMSVTVTRLDPVPDSSGNTTLQESSSWISLMVPQPDRSDPGFREKGKIGFFCEPGTVIGITNVIVNKRGKAMISIPATW